MRGEMCLRQPPPALVKNVSRVVRQVGNTQAHNPVLNRNFSIQDNKNRSIYENQI